jgi:hypothetical protein
MLHGVLGVLTQGARKRKKLQLALHAHACSLRCTLSAIRSGTRYAKWVGGSRSQTHRRAAMGRLYSRRRLCARRGADARLLLGILLELVLFATSASPRAKSLIPIPVPVQYRLSRCLE